MIAFRQKNGVEVAVVIINSLQGYDVAQYNFGLAEQWGIGKTGEDNGVSFLIAIDDRKMNISTGYGLEDFVPDALAKRIIETVVKPEFKQGNYFAGISKGLEAIEGLVMGKFKAEDFQGKKKKNKWFTWVWVGLFMIYLIIKRQ
ncbi:MAG: hypothetical protein ACI8ZO_000571 [Flavobacteriales bacterium]|jgi:uncharacterized protein